MTQRKLVGDQHVEIAECARFRPTPPPRPRRQDFCGGMMPEPAGEAHEPRLTGHLHRCMICRR
jgi:hypothetical protein